MTDKARHGLDLGQMKKLTLNFGSHQELGWVGIQPSYLLSAQCMHRILFIQRIANSTHMFFIKDIFLCDEDNILPFITYLLEF